MIIHILDKYENVTGVLSDEAPFSCPFFDDVHTENIRLGTNSFEFSVPANHEMADKIKVEGSVIFPNIDGKLQMFKIKDIEETTDDSGYVKRITSEHIAISDLLTDVVRPTTFTVGSLDGAVNYILRDTEYKLGDWFYSENQEITFEKHVTVLEALYNIAETFQVEMQFEVKFVNGKITERLIHLNEKLGTVTNKLFTYSKDLIDVTRTENSEALVTALIGIGKGDSEGDAVTLEGYNPEYLPEGFYKKLDEDFIYSEDALQSYGKNGKHKYGIYVSEDAEDKKTLAEETIKQLKARSVPSVKWEMSVALLEKVTGYSADKVRVGDTINAKDITMKPTLMLEARILEVKRSYTKPEDDAIVLGDYKPISIGNYDTVKKLQEALIANEEKWNNSGVSIPQVEEVVEGKISPIERDLSDVKEVVKDKEYAIIRQASEPTGTDFIVGQLWIDNSDFIHRWTGTGWKKMISVSLSDIGGVSSEEYNSKMQELTTDIGDKVGAEFVDGQLKLKADVADVYTKVETEDKLGAKADASSTYTKTEVNNALDSKVENTTFTTSMDGVVSDLESHESRIKQTEDKIESTVSSEEYSQKVLELNNNIQGKADADDVYTKTETNTKLNGKADTSTVTAIETRVSNAESSIEQTDKAIALKVNSEDVYTKAETNNKLGDKADTSDLTVVAERVSETEAFIEVNEDKIVNAVSKSEVETAIDGVEIGGRNLLKNTSFRNTSGWYGWGSTIGSTSLSGENFKQVLAINENAEVDRTVGFRSGNYSGIDNTFKVRVGQEYTLSFLIRSSNIPSLDYMYLMHSVGGNTSLQALSFGEFSKVSLGGYEYYKMHMTFSPSKDDDNAGVLISGRSAGGRSYMYVTNVKIEKGNKVTDWQTAPEDVDAEIDEANTRISDAETRITQTEKDITSKVSQTEYNADISGLNTKMQNAESEISQNAKSITSKVSETDFTGQKIISMVSQTSSSYKILAKNIELAGAVKFTDFDSSTQSKLNSTESTANSANSKASNAQSRVGSVEGKINSAVTTIDSKGVTVKDGSFYLEDSVSGLKSTAVFKPNMLNDHSFESLKENWSKNHGTGIFDVGATSGNNFQWNTTKEPRLISSLSSELSLDYAMFGFKSAVVNNLNYLDQYVQVSPNTTYTISWHTRRLFNNPTGTSRTRIRFYDENYDQVADLMDFEATNSTYENARYSGTFTTPSGCYSIRVYCYAVNNNWVVNDGYQLVTGDTPAPYNPEDSMGQLINGNLNATDLVTDNLSVKNINLGNMTPLWSGGGIYMQLGQTVKPSKPLSSCLNGWLLVWARYSGGNMYRDNLGFSHIHKGRLEVGGGGGLNFVIGADDSRSDIFRKYIYASDTEITGNDVNRESPDNQRVLIRVYEY